MHSPGRAVPVLVVLWRFLTIIHTNAAQLSKSRGHFIQIKWRKWMSFSLSLES